MRNLALVYLFNRFFYRIFEFLEHWYIKSFKYYSNFCLNQFEKLDRFFAWKITFKNLFKPLFGDYSWLGYVLGISFRFFRFFVTGIIYAVLFVFSVIVYLVWIFTPPLLVFKIFSN